MKMDKHIDSDKDELHSEKIRSILDNMPHVLILINAINILLIILTLILILLLYPYPYGTSESILRHICS